MYVCVCVSISQLVGSSSKSINQSINQSNPCFHNVVSHQITVGSSPFRSPLPSSLPSSLFFPPPPSPPLSLFLSLHRFPIKKKEKKKKHIPKQLLYGQVQEQSKILGNGKMLEYRVVMGKEEKRILNEKREEYGERRKNGERREGGQGKKTFERNVSSKKKRQVDKVQYHACSEKDSSASLLALQAAF